MLISHKKIRRQSFFLKKQNLVMKLNNIAKYWSPNIVYHRWICYLVQFNPIWYNFVEIV